MRLLVAKLYFTACFPVEQGLVCKRLFQIPDLDILVLFATLRRRRIQSKVFETLERIHGGGLGLLIVARNQGDLNLIAASISMSQR
jgi:hypothetical protein